MLMVMAAVMVMATTTSLPPRGGDGEEVPLDLAPTTRCRSSWTRPCFPTYSSVVNNNNDECLHSMNAVRYHHAFRVWMHV